MYFGGGRERRLHGVADHKMRIAADWWDDDKG
jgi:hypothetical protein